MQKASSSYQPVFCHWMSSVPIKIPLTDYGPASNTAVRLRRRAIIGELETYLLIYGLSIKAHPYRARCDVRGGARRNTSRDSDENCTIEEEEESTCTCSTSYPPVVAPVKSSAGSQAALACTSLRTAALGRCPKEQSSSCLPAHLSPPRENCGCLLHARGKPMEPWSQSFSAAPARPMPKLLAI